MNEIIKKLLIIASLGLYTSTIFAQTSPIHVVASFSILADIVRNIGQSRVQVTEIVGPEKDVHTFQPSPNDVKKLTKAHLILVNGLGLEGWISRMITASGYNNQVVSIAEQLPTLLEEAAHKHGSHHHHSQYDPHVWQDPLLMKSYVNYVTKALVAIDPSSKSFYEANARQYNNQLDSLHAWVEKMLMLIPVPKRQVITSHEAFSYLGRRYKINFIALQGTNTASESSARDIAALIQYIRKTGIRALCLDNVGERRLAQILVKEANVRMGGKLYSDSLSKTQLADTYIKMYRYNIEVLATALKQNN